MSRHEKQLRVAMRRGYHVDKKTNIGAMYRPQLAKLLTFDGWMAFPTPPGYSALMSFDGPSWTMTGEFTFEHWDTKVLTVNFDEGWITDYGYDGYSKTTDNNLYAWQRAMRRFLPRLPWDWQRWTANWRRKHPTGRCIHGFTPEPNENLVRFRAGVPWVQPVGFRYYGANQRPWGPGNQETTWRFYWGKYDEALSSVFWKSNEFLSENRNQRYFKYDWADYVPEHPRPSDWVRSFIDRDAERRWRAREKRNGRACPPISSHTKTP